MKYVSLSSDNKRIRNTMIFIKSKYADSSKSRPWQSQFIARRGVTDKILL